MQSMESAAFYIVPAYFRYTFSRRFLAELRAEI
jgi:hypothetical protein